MNALRRKPSRARKQACERRVFRLATLLIGDPEAATRVLDAVVRAQPDLLHLDSVHLDRLTILRAREEDAAATGVLSGVPAQQREAWVLLRVYRLPEREVARSMDCSLTATRRHLALAEAALGDAADARSLGRFSASLDVPEFYLVKRAAREQRRRVLALAGIIALILAAMWVLTKTMV